MKEFRSVETMNAAPRIQTDFHMATTDRVPLRLAVVIPTYNRWHEARITLAHLRNSTYRDFDVVLVEDGCTDGTVENCRAEFPEVTILNGDGDLWWSGAINMGVEYAMQSGADAIIWMNDDNRVEPSTLAVMGESYQRTGPRSIITARTRSTDHEETDEWAGDPPLWHPDFEDWKPLDLSGEIVPIRHPPGGRGVLIPVECFREIGLIDRRAFPHYWADYDFHYRAMKAGYRYYLASDAIVWNVPNAPGKAPAGQFSLSWARWFLFDRRSAMNMLVLRRLLKRHLPARQYRATFYPLLWRSLAWLASGWAARKPLVHRSLRTIRRNLISGKRA